MIVRNAAGRAEFSSRKMGKCHLASGDQVFAGLNCFLPGQAHALHSHGGQDKIYFVLEGRGQVTVGSDTETVEAGDLVLAAEGVPHAMENTGPDNLIVMAVMAPPPGKARHGS